MKKHNLVGDKLKELLNQHGKSNRELAYQTGIADNIWSKLINGSIRLNVDQAIRLSKVFTGVTAHGIIDGHQSYGYEAWLLIQYESDCLNAEEQDGPMYAKIKTF